VVFTLPHELIPLARQNPTVVYNIFFRAVSQALLTIAADPQHLGARLGFLAVLHTWNQKLLAHPHIHCLVPAGGIAFDQTRWIGCRHPKFFLPGKVFGAKFRGSSSLFSGARFVEASSNSAERWRRFRSTELSIDLPGRSKIKTGSSTPRSPLRARGMSFNTWLITLTA
jgi:hypothetical protein